MANLALVSLGASATHNKSIWQSTPANNAIDNNAGTWTLIQNPAPTILTVDLGQVGSITDYEVEWVNDSWVAVNYTVESSADGSTGWTVRHTVTGGGVNGTSGPTALTTPASARYWRLNSTQNGINAVEGMGPSLFALHGTGAPSSQNLTVPSLTNTPTFHALTVSVPPIQNLTVPSLTNAPTFHALTLSLLTAKVLTLSHFSNSPTFHALTAVRGSSPGFKVKLWGSPVPFWIQQDPHLDEQGRKTYAMPFRAPTGGPGMRVVLPGLGTRAAFWVEEHPDNPGTYVFPFSADPEVFGGAMFGAGLNGESSLVWKGTWSFVTPYETGDVVVHNGSSYVATQDGSGQSPPSNPLTWQLIAAKGATGETGLSASHVMVDETLAEDVTEKTMTIPGGYRSVRLELLIGQDTPGSHFCLQFGSDGDVDTEENYDAAVSLSENGMPPTSSVVTGINHIPLTDPASSDPGSFCMVTVEIPFYRETTVRKQARSEASQQGDDNIVSESSATGWWRKLDAIDRIRIFASGDASLVAGSIFRVVGVQ